MQVVFVNQKIVKLRNIFRSTYSYDTVEELYLLFLLLWLVFGQ